MGIDRRGLLLFVGRGDERKRRLRHDAAIVQTFDDSSVLTRRCWSHLEHQRHRTVVHELDEHVRAEDARADVRAELAQGVGELVDQG